MFNMRLQSNTHTPEKGKTGRYYWIGLFMAELWFTLHWLITQLVRWNPVTHHTFRDQLSQKYEKVLPGVDIFVCTADPMIEPPLMVINTVLSMMAYNYPPENLNVYVSDDGGSELMFYALLVLVNTGYPFAKGTRLSQVHPQLTLLMLLLSTMNGHPSRKRIDDTTRLGKVTEEMRKEHKGFQEWDVGSSKSDHQAVLQILIDQRDPEARDTDGKSLPGLVYVAREKRREWHHNFKAGAMNAFVIYDIIPHTIHVYQKVHVLNVSLYLAYWA